MYHETENNTRVITLTPERAGITQQTHSHVHEQRHLKHCTDKRGF